MGPIQMHREANFPVHLVKCQCTTISLATLVEFPAPMFSAKIQPQGILEEDF